MIIDNVIEIKSANKAMLRLGVKRRAPFMVNKFTLLPNTIVAKQCRLSLRWLCYCGACSSGSFTCRNVVADRWRVDTLLNGELVLHLTLQQNKDLTTFTPMWTISTVAVLLWCMQQWIVYLQKFGGGVQACGHAVKRWASSPPHITAEQRPYNIYTNVGYLYGGCVIVVHAAVDRLLAEMWWRSAGVNEVAECWRVDTLLNGGLVLHFTLQQNKDLTIFTPMWTISTVAVLLWCIQQWIVYLQKCGGGVQACGHAVKRWARRSPPHITAEQRPYNIYTNVDYLYGGCVIVVHSAVDRLLAGMR
ncbi:hypothetical protein J6590_106193 [Homalodisca vitripennis]|nr:hypothetical protein J6590_106193 [Homalodisca vitripennis]